MKIRSFYESLLTTCSRFQYNMCEFVKFSILFVHSRLQYRFEAGLKWYVIYLSRATWHFLKSESKHVAALEKYKWTKFWPLASNGTLAWANCANHLSDFVLEKVWKNSEKCIYLSKVNSSSFFFFFKIPSIVCNTFFPAFSSFPHHYSIKFELYKGFAYVSALSLYISISIFLES